MCSHRKTRIIGVGNPLMGDDGLGIVALEQLRERQLPPEAELIDAGTGGITLLQIIAECERALIIDAADFGRPAGTILRLQSSQLLDGKSDGGALSLHQNDLADVLLLGKQLDQLPETTLFLMQPKRVERRLGLSPEVREHLPEMLDGIVEELSRSRQTKF